MDSVDPFEALVTVWMIWALSWYDASAHRPGTLTPFL